MKKLYLLLTLLTSLFFACISININEIAARCNEQINFIESTKSDYTVFYVGESNYENEFYYLNKSCSIYNNNKIRSDILMMREIPKCDFNRTILNLTKTDIAISKNVAISNNLSLGDTLTIKSAFTNNDKLYKIKKIISSCYGVSNDYISASTGLVIIGYNSELINSLSESIAFVKHNQNLNSLNINKFISNEKTISNLKHNINTSVLIDVLLCFFGCLIIYICMNIVDRNEFSKKIKIGYELKILFKLYPLFYGFVSFPFILIFNLINFLVLYFKLNCVYLITINYTFIGLLILLVIYFLIFKNQIRRI